jgi:hypothetical protein
LIRSGKTTDPNLPSSCIWALGAGRGPQYRHMPRCRRHAAVRAWASGNGGILGKPTSGAYDVCGISMLDGCSTWSSDEWWTMMTTEDAAVPLEFELFGLPCKRFHCLSTSRHTYVFYHFWLDEKHRIPIHTNLVTSSCDTLEKWANEHARINFLWMPFQMKYGILYSTS